MQGQKLSFVYTCDSFCFLFDLQKGISGNHFLSDKCHSGLNKM